MPQKLLLSAAMLGLAAILCVAMMTVISAPLTAPEPSVLPAAAPVELATQAHTTIPASTRFWARALEGRIAIYSDTDDSTPILHTTIEVDKLRAYDRQRLESGILVASEEELLMLLEDFAN